MAGGVLPPKVALEVQAGDLAQMEAVLQVEEVAEAVPQDEAGSAVVLRVEVVPLHGKAVLQVEDAVHGHAVQQQAGSDVVLGDEADLHSEADLLWGEADHLVQGEGDELVLQVQPAEDLL